MLFRRAFGALGAGLILAALTPSVARADGLFVPFYGVNFGGDSGQNLSSAFDAKRSDWGFSLAWMGAGVIGLEGDFGYTSDFYGKTDVGGSSALTLTGNLLLGIPFGGQKGFGVRPYGLIGAGLVRSNVDSFKDVVGFDNNDAAWDVGGGLMIFFSSHVGMRGDVRYFRTFKAVDFLDIASRENVDFGRGSVGLILRF
jgi:opacity protein-like surface antigen